MAGRLTSAVHTTVSAATAGGFLTVGSSTGFYVGAKCWLSNTGNTLQDLVQITEINGTSVGVRKVPQTYLGTQSAPNYGRSDVSAYNGGGFLDQEPQFIYNRDDADAP